MRLITSWLLSLLLIFSSLSVFGAPACPYPVKVKQPDGSEITIKLIGDERVHWAETMDGYTLLGTEKNAYEYAYLDSLGALRPSGLVANEVGKRTAQEQKLLKKLKKALRYNTEQVKGMKARWNATTHSDSLIGNTHLFTATSTVYNPKNGPRRIKPLGVKRTLMIMIQFPDKPFLFSRNDFDSLMNYPNYRGHGANGSFHDFYYEMSYGKFDLTTDVVGIYTADHELNYYGERTATVDDIRREDLVKEAVAKAAADGVDFSLYDNDGDGETDSFFILYSGYAENTGGASNTIWPHAGALKSISYNGIKVGTFGMSSERGTDDKMTSIGMICHEFGHTCGAPDYYDTDYETNSDFGGIGGWDVMAYGCFNTYNGTGGNCPSHFNPYEKVRAGWITPDTLSSPISLSIPDVTTHPVAYIYKTTTPNEWYIMENRQKTGFNIAAPGHGLMVYHYSKSYWNLHTDNAAPMGFYPVCASATTSPTTTSAPSSYGSMSSGGCPFPGTTGKTSFTDETIPSAKSWAGANTNAPLLNITETAGNITLDFISAPAVNPILVFAGQGAFKDQVHLNWTKNSAGNEVLVAYNSTATFGNPTDGSSYQAGDLLPGGGTVIYKGGDTVFDQTGLSTNTKYYYQIWAVNGSNIYSTARSDSATTTVASLSTNLFTENFETSFSSRWSQEYVSGTVAWKQATRTPNLKPSATYAGTYFGTFSWTNDYSQYKTKLVTVPLDMTGATNPTLRFWHAQSLWAGQDILRVYYKTSALDTWKQLAIYIQDISSWKQETITLPEVSSTMYVAFEGMSNVGGGVCLDDIEIWKNYTTGPNVWAGTVSSDWFNADNWSWGLVPLRTSDVQVPASTPFAPSIDASGAVCKNLTIDSGGALSMNASTSYTLSMSGNFVNNGTFTAGKGTVSFDAASPLQTIEGSSTTAFYAIKVNKTSVDNVLEVKSQISLTAAVSSTSPVNLSSGTFKLSSASTINLFSWPTMWGGVGIWNNGGVINSLSGYFGGTKFRCSAGTLNIGTINLYGDGTSFVIEGGTVNLTGSIAPYSSGVYSTVYNQSGGTFLVNTTASTALNISSKSGSSFTMSGGSIVFQKASSTANYLNQAPVYSVTGGTFQFGNASTSASPVMTVNTTVPMYNVVLNGTGTPTLKLLSDLTVNNSITIASGTKVDMNSKTCTVKGDWINNGGSLTTTPTGKVVFGGSVSQVMSGSVSTVFNKMSMNNVSGLNLNAVNVTVNDTLALLSGVIVTNSSKVIVPSTGKVVRNSGHVCGNLQKYLGVGSDVLAKFEVGDNAVNSYAPVSLNFTTVNTGGSIVATTNPVAHSDLELTNLSPSRVLNRYWSFINTGVGFSSWDGDFSFNSSDVSPFAKTAKLASGVYEGTGWQYPLTSIVDTVAHVSSVSVLGDVQFAELATTDIVSGLNSWTASKIQIHANPAHQLLIHVDNSDEVVTEVELCDLVGKCVYRNEFSGAQMLTNSLPSGVYVVVVKRNNYCVRQKVTI